MTFSFYDLILSKYVLYTRCNIVSCRLTVVVVNMIRVICFLSNPIRKSLEAKVDSTLGHSRCPNNVLRLPFPLFPWWNYNFPPQANITHSLLFTFPSWKSNKYFSSEFQLTEHATFNFVYENIIIVFLGIHCSQVIMFFPRPPRRENITWGDLWKCIIHNLLWFNILLIFSGLVILTHILVFTFLL